MRQAIDNLRAQIVDARSSAGQAGTMLDELPIGKRSNNNHNRRLVAQKALADAYQALTTAMRAIEGIDRFPEIPRAKLDTTGRVYRRSVIKS